MPELPEVETARRGLEPHLTGRRVIEVRLRRSDLRWPIAHEVRELLPGQRIAAVDRRAKYLLLATAAGSALVHLGMSGALRFLDAGLKPAMHDHYDLLLEDGRLLRYSDPRRFGCLLWQGPGTLHPLLRRLGPEPLGPGFHGDHLWQLARGRTLAVKAFLMDQSIVVGVGNIYAAEALHAAGIDPRRSAGRVSRARYAMLAATVRDILSYAIERGGTTLRDFINPDGQPGYFEQELNVYGREGQPCRRCNARIQCVQLGGRSTFYCPRCQR